MRMTAHGSEVLFEIIGALHLQASTYGDLVQKHITQLAV